MPYGPTHKENYMPYGPTHKENTHKEIICLMGLLTKKLYALWAYKENYMPYGPKQRKKYALWAYSQRKLYALWAYLQRNYMPYGPTRKEIICLMGLLTNKNILSHEPMGLPTNIIEWPMSLLKYNYLFLKFWIHRPIIQTLNFS